jgi:C-terminal processing protease CtpA/Prc
MKLGFGLLSLLIAVAIVLYLQAQSATQVNKVRKEVTPQVEQMAGQGFASSYAAELVEVNGKVRGIKISKLAVDGPMAKYFGGLKVGDEVVEVGPMAVRDTDPDLVMGLLKEAGIRSSTLKVLRNGQTIEIPCIGPVNERNGRTGVELPGGLLGK